MTLAQDMTAQMTAALRKAGVRVTRQRIALLAVLVGADDHPDAEELYKRTKRVEPAVSLATVYRTLSVLEAEGVVQRHSFEGGGARFEATGPAHHDHIVDLDSGEVFEFNSDKIERLQEQIAAELGYDLVHHRMELYCRRRKP
ncbi:MAG: transcriptional repressor [Rhodobacterales bacterium]|nr:transcriptional repressor [Rhodobacterales bacterium]